MNTETTHLRWFDQYGSCGQCGKKSEGILRGDQNQSYGDHCKKCADKRLKASKNQRDMK